MLQVLFQQILIKCGDIILASILRLEIIIFLAGWMLRGLRTVRALGGVRFVQSEPIKLVDGRLNFQATEAAVERFLESQQNDTAYKFVGQMIAHTNNPTTKSYNRVIAGFMEGNQVDEAKRLLDEMKQNNVPRNGTTKKLIEKLDSL